MSLQEKACLVTLTVKQWTARKLDKRANRDIVCAHGNDVDWTKVSKALLPDESIKPLRQFCREIRAYHYTMTLPWDDAGARIISTKAYFEYVQQMNTFADEFNVRVERLCQDYENLKAQARQHLNGLFNASDYPKNVRARFGFETHFSPIPIGDDMRISIGQYELDKVRQDIEAQTKELLSSAVGDICERIKTVVSACKDKLADSKAVFRDTLITNITDLCGIIPMLNILDDPAIDQLANRMRNELTQVAPDDLRKHPKQRAAVANKAQSILDGMSGLMGGA